MIAWDDRQARLSLVLFLVLVIAGLLKMHFTRPVYPETNSTDGLWPPAGCLVDASVLENSALEVFPGGTDIRSAVVSFGLDVDPLGSGFRLPRAAVLLSGPGGWTIRPMTQLERWVWRIPMDIHRVMPDDLSRIDGIGPSLGQRIYEYVREKKCLASLDDLLKVPGVGPSRIKSLRKELAMN